MATDEKNLAKRSFKAISWSLFFQFTSQFAQLVIGILLVRLLTPEDYGILGVLSIFWALSDRFIQGGFTAALTQRKTVSELDLSSVFYYNMFLGFSLCFLMQALAPTLADFFHRPILSKTIVVSAWCLPIGALCTVQRVLLVRDLRQRVVAFTGFVSVLISGAVALLLGWRGYGVWALVWHSFILTACNTVFIFLFVRWIPGLKFSFQALGSLFQYGSKLLVVGLLDTIFKNLNKVVVGKLFPNNILGYFTRAQQYATLWPFSIQNSISDVLFPAFSKIQDDLIRQRQAFIRALAAFSFVIIFPSFLLCTLSRPFIELLLSPQWLPCLKYWSLLTLAIVFWPVQELCIQLLNSRGRAGLVLILEIVRKSFVIITLIVVYFKGIVPMLIADIGLSFLCTLIFAVTVKREIQLTLWSQVNSVLPYVATTVISCMCAWLFYRALTVSFPWIAFIGGATIGCLCYLLLNMFCKTVAFCELIKMAGHKIPLVGNRLVTFCNR